MNLPNKLSILRVLCIPVIVLLEYLQPDWCHWAALALFIIAALTDFLDGHLARKNNWVTDFGKFIDPVADKLLVLCTFVMMIEKGWLPAWLVVLILTRELSVDGLRLVAMTKNKVIAAGWSGKVKTFSQMIFIVAVMVFRIPAFSHWALTAAACWIALITLYSGVEYFRKNASLFASR